MRQDNTHADSFRSGLESLAHNGGGWPVTILPARYSGSYEGGRWLAFPCEYNSVPDEVYGSDVECSIWWRTAEAASMVGRGEAPDAALADLLRLAAEGAWR